MSDKPDKMNLILHRNYYELNGIKPFSKVRLNYEQNKI